MAATEHGRRYTHGMPSVTILAGPNGAGKTSVSRSVVHDLLAVRTYVNVEQIARGLAGFAPESVMAPAERIKLDALARLAQKRVDIGFETTLAGLDFSAYLGELRDNGYPIRLAYVWLASADLSVERVRHRVDSGGQTVDEPLIRERYERSLENLFRIYLPVVDEWRVYDNSSPNGASIVAESGRAAPTIIHQMAIWDVMQRKAGR
jgi:predicted ABC-type ATPase